MKNKGAQTDLFAAVADQNETTPMPEKPKSEVVKTAAAKPAEKTPEKPKTSRK